MVNMRAGLPRLGTVCDEYRLGREDVGSASGPASPVLTEYGRRVGGLGPGLTSESADALSGCPANPKFPLSSL